MISLRKAEKDIRDLMNIPDNYKVLFLQGGASQQFAMIPMNLMKNKKAAYIITGQWAKKAYKEAQIYGDAVAVASPLKTRHFPISRTAPIWIFRKMRIMYTFVKTIPFTEPNFRHCQTPKERPWWRMFLPVSCQNRLM